jgi:DNA repair protein RecO (recombination protein O)
MSELMNYLGIKPQEYTDADPLHFNLVEGTFSKNIPPSNEPLDPDTTRILGRLFGMHLEDYTAFHPTTVMRNRLLNLLIRYYEIHLPGFHGMKSHLVLHTVFS